MAYGLRERREIGKYQGKLVEFAENLVNEASPIWEKLEESQLRNVAGVAAGAECVPVVTNFIKYQIGRRPEWGFEGFGQKVIDQMKNLKKKAESIAGEKPSEEQTDEIWIELCRSFWGYVIRYSKYREKGGQS